jgi:hypothetical protein
MRWIVSLVGIVLAFVGGFWILQGTNIIPVGFMAGQMQFTLLGALVAALGIGLLVLANRRARQSKAGPSSHGPTSGII